jgi:predicted exporter
MSIRNRFLAWTAIVGAVGALFLVDVRPHLKIETDVLALLPADERDRALDEAARRFADGLSRRALFLVGAPSFAQAKSAATRFAAALREPGVFAAVRLEIDATADVVDFYRPHQALLLSDRHRAGLEAGEDQRLYDEALHGIYGLAGLARPLPVTEDPLNLLGDFLLGQLTGFGGATLREGVLEVSDAGRAYVLVTTESAQPPFSLAARDRLMPAIEAALAQARSQPDVTVLSSGLILHAAAASRRAQAEISSVGSISMIGVLLLVWLTFRSPRPLALSLAALGTGALGAIVACHYLFGGVHLITLVFGTGLIGVAIDYSTHFLADQFRNRDGWSPREALAHVGPSIVTGMICAVLGYAALMLAPLPGLRQMAVFAAVGLAAACASVLFWYPVLARASSRGTAPLLLRLSSAVDAALSRRGRRADALIFIALAPIIGLGFWRLDFVDDVRALQSSPPELMAQERAVQALLRAAPDSRFFVIRAASPEQVLQAEERLALRLQPLIAQGALQGYVAVSRSLPSQRRQAQNRGLLAKKVYADGGLLPRLMQQLGYPATALQERRVQLDRQAEPLTIDAWLQHPASHALRGLWLGKLGAQYTSVVTLAGVRDPAPLPRLERDVPEAKLVDKVAQTSALMGRYRQIAAILIACAYVLIGALLAWRYGPRVAPRLLAAPLAAAAVSLATFGLLGLPANLFNVMGLFMVLGLGVDYAVFLREGRRDGGAGRSATVLAITLSAIGTVLAYGLLAFSATPFIRTIGLTLLVGISATYVLALLVQSRDISERDNGRFP